MKLHGLGKRSRRLITMSLMVVVAGTGLSAPAAADFRPQMEASVKYEPSVLRAPAANRPKSTVTWEGSLYFSGYDSVPKAFGTTATLTLPRGVAVQSVSPSQCKADGRAVRCYFGTVASDEVKKLTVTAKVIKADVGDRLGATLVAQARNVDRNPAGGSGEDRGPVIVENTADLEAGFDSWRESVAPGAEISYGITATNNGPLTTAPAVLLIKPGAQIADPKVDYPNSEKCTHSAEGFRCPFERWMTLNVSGSVRADAEGTTLKTTVSVEFSGEDPPVDPTPSNNSETIETHVEQRADVGVALTVSPETLTPAELQDNPTLTYRAVVTNKGPGVARETKLTTRLSTGSNWGGVKFVSAPEGCEIDDRVVCVIGRLAVGASREFVIQAKANPKVDGEFIQAESEVEAANNEYNLPNDNQSSQRVKVPGNHADRSIEVGVESNQIVAGRPFTIVAKATNHGPLPKADTAVEVRLDTHMPDAEVRMEGGTCRLLTTSNNDFECRLSELTDEPREVKITITGATLEPGTQLTGMARVLPIDYIPVDHNGGNNTRYFSAPIVAPGRA